MARNRRPNPQLRSYKRQKGQRSLWKRTHLAVQHTDKRKAAPRAESALNEKHTRIAGQVKRFMILNAADAALRHANPEIATAFSIRDTKSPVIGCQTKAGLTQLL
jgi:hypothetical protein